MGGSANNEDNNEDPSSPYNLLSDDNGDENNNNQDAGSSWVIYAVIIAFCVLVGFAMLLTFFSIRKYGLVALVFILVLMGLLVGLIVVIDSSMKENARYRPIRRKVQTLTTTIRQALIDEFFAFRREYNEYLLLTDGSAYGNKNEDNPNDELLEVPENGVPPSDLAGRTTRKKKSVLFRVVKPFLKVKRKNVS